MLESREVTKNYGSKTAVSGVSLKLEPGLVYAMLGPNGSGKTTWMKLTEDMKAKKLSSGMMAKLKIAVTMARSAKIYLLDEPLNGIDLLARDQIMTSILEAADKDVTLVVSSHLVDELERVVDAAIFMKEGQLVEQCMVEDLRMNRNKSVVDLYREIYGHGGEAQC